MSGKIKVNGSWKLSEKLSVKVAGTWVDAKFAYVKVAGTWVKWFSALIYDSFTRTTSGSLGSTTSGTPWEAIKGTWFANGTAAQSNDTPDNYSIAAIPLDANATVSASVVPGTGVAFWVTDANSWWAATSQATGSTYSCNCGTCYQSCPCASCGICQDCGYVNGACAVYAPCSDNYGAGAVGGSTLGPGYDATACYNYSTKAYLGPRACQTYKQVYQCGPQYSCPGTYACNPYSCNCSTCDSTSYFLRLVKSVGGTVSTATSDVSLTAAAAAIAVSTQGNQVTVKAYSNTNMTTELGSIVYTAASPVAGIKSGIIKSPSASAQGSTVDDFRLTI